MATRTPARAGLAASSLSSLELLDRIKATLSKDDILPKGDGWRTAEEWATEWSLKGARARQLCNIALKEGIFERFEGKRGKIKVNFFRQIPQ